MRCLIYSIEAAAGQRALRCLYYGFYAKGTTNYVTQMTIVSSGDYAIGESGIVKWAGLSGARLGLCSFRGGPTCTLPWRPDGPSLARLDSNGCQGEP